MSSNTLDVSIAPYTLHSCDGLLLTDAALCMREFLSQEQGPAGESGSPDEQGYKVDAGSPVEAAVTHERVDGVPAPISEFVAPRHSTWSPRDTPAPPHVHCQTGSKAQHHRDGGSKRDLGSVSLVTAPDLAKKPALQATLRLRSTRTSPRPIPRTQTVQPMSRPTHGVIVKGGHEAAQLSTGNFSKLVSGQGSEPKLTEQALANKQALKATLRLRSRRTSPTPHTRVSQPISRPTSGVILKRDPDAMLLCTGQENDGIIITKKLSIPKAPVALGEHPCLLA